MNNQLPVLFLDPYPRTEAMVYTPATQQELAQLGRVVVHFGSRAPADLIDSILPEVDVIIGQTEMPKARLERATRLKAIINVKGNWEPTVDYTCAQARGIYVLSAAPAMAPCVAEACVGSAIALGRNLLISERRFRAGKEAYGIAGNEHAYSLYDAPVGLIGFGNLGRALVALLRPFQCEISVYDPWLSPGYLNTFGVAAQDLDSLLSKSQFVFILAGVTRENEQFLNRRKLALIPNDASLVLASRAEVVDFDALTEMAQAGRFRAAIDVFPEEPVPKDAPYRHYDKILFTSHLAGGLHASYARIREMMIDDVRQILAGRPPLRLQRAEPAQAAISRSR